MRPNAQPVMNNMTMATTLETLMAGTAFCMKMKGIATGNVVRKTSRKTPAAPIQSSLI